MKPPIRCLAPALAAVALAGAAAAAPAAVAAPATPHPAAPSAAAPGEDGSDPLVPTNTGANPFVFVPPGDELPG